MPAGNSPPELRLLNRYCWESVLDTGNKGTKMARNLRFNSSSNADIFLDKVSVKSSEESSASGHKLHATAFYSYLKKATFDSTRTPQKNHAMDSCSRFYSTQNLSPHKSWHQRKVINVHAFETRRELCTFVNETAPCLHYIYILCLGRGDAGEQTAMARWEQNKTTSSTFNRHRIPYSDVPTPWPDLGTQGWGQRF